MSWLPEAEMAVLRFLAKRRRESGRWPTVARLEDLRTAVARAQHTTASSVSLDDITTLAGSLLLLGEVGAYADVRVLPSPDPERRDLWLIVPTDGAGPRLARIIDGMNRDALEELIRKKQVELSTITAPSGAPWQAFGLLRERGEAAAAAILMTAAEANQGALGKTEA